MKSFRILLLMLLTVGVIGHAFGDGQLHTRTRYTLRSGDSISLDYRLTPEINQTVMIQPDGFVNLKLIGDIRISGLTVEQVHDLIVEKVSTRLNHPELNVVLKEFERPYFAVSGEVDHPGRMDFYEHTTALQAIMLAGGFKESAQQSQVLIFRKVNDDLSQVIKLNLHNVNKSADLEHDMILQPGDIVLVPRNKLENVARFIKATNLGFYLNPLTYVTP
jgi:polysaccharide export outer membrane protein